MTHTHTVLDTLDILDLMRAGAGCTIDSTTGEDITAGYAVATNLQLRVPDGETIAFLPVIVDFINIARGHYFTLGAWATRGFREYAATEVIEDRDHAILVARQRGEESIFDLAAGIEVPVR